MIYALAVLILLFVVGAMSGPKTLLHSFAMGLDCFMQNLICDDDLSITISARCGLLQLQGIKWPALIVNWIMRNQNHSIEAIGWDIDRAKSAIKLLTATKMSET